MDISYTQLKLFWFCPAAWQEKYVGKIEPRPGEPLIFGGRFHELLEDHMRRLGNLAPNPHGPLDPALDPDGRLEREAQMMMAAYEAHYPVEPFGVLAVEDKHYVPLPGSEHRLICVFDAVLRDKSSRRLGLKETKTERRGSKGNSIDAWNARGQISLYKWAAEQVYGEPVDNIIVDVCTRASPKGQEPPSFRRQLAERDPEQVDHALWAAVETANQIENYLARGRFLRNTENCVSHTGWRCDYYHLHNTEDSEQIRKQLFVEIREENAL